MSLMNAWQRLRRILPMAAMLLCQEHVSLAQNMDALPALPSRVETLTNERRPPVHPRRNVEEFAPVRARFLRMTILETTRGEPCIDELEVWTTGSPARNVALASAGTQVDASGTLPGYEIHKLEHINDGLYGNGRSWISTEASRGWVQLEFARPESIHRIVWGRDREGNFVDRLISRYKFEVAMELGEWTTVASSDDRHPLDPQIRIESLNPALTLAINRFAPVNTSLPGAQSRSTRDYVIRTWQTEDGLPNNTITSILQSRDGYLWLGTLNGLVRFDGIRFLTYGDADGLPSPRVTCLTEGLDGQLWIGTEGGVARLQNGQFTIATDDDGLPHNTVLSINYDASGRVWAGTLRGLAQWDGSQWINYSATHNLPRHTYFRLLPVADGSVFALSAETPLLMIKDHQIHSPPFMGEPAQYSSLLAISKAPDGALWVAGANAYIARLETDRRVTVLGAGQALLSDSVWEIREAQNGDVWIGTASGGLTRLRDDQWLVLTTQEGLSDNSIRALCEDSEGNIWVGTNGGGLMRLRERRVTTAGTREGMSHDVAMSMVQTSDDRIWIGTNCGGLTIWKDGQFSPFAESYLLDNLCVRSLAVDHDNHLWIGTWGEGLIRLQPDGVSHYRWSDGLPDNVLSALHPDRQGNLWIGTYSGGLARFTNGTFHVLGSDDGMDAQSITSILEDSKDQLWFGTATHGLAILENSDASRFRWFTRDNGLGSNFIRCLHEDSTGTLWVGTSHGLAHLHADGSFRNLTQTNGLVDHFISQILEDNDGNLWVGSNQGIFRLTRPELSRIIAGDDITLNPLYLGKGEGLETLECTGGFHPAGLKTRDGHLWFSTVKGVVQVDPTQIIPNPVPPKVWIEAVSVDNPVLPSTPKVSSTTSPASASIASSASLSTELPLRIPHNTQRLEFNFTAISLTAPERVRILYRLVGLDSRWTPVGAQRTAVYPRIPSGSYRFEVIASNNDGIWNNRGATFSFIVHNPFWRSLWFLILVASLLVGGVIALARHVSFRNLRSTLLGLEEQHALERERARIARDIHDDLGAGLTQIGWLSEFGQKQAASPEQSRAYFQQIGSGTREIVQAMDAIVWAVNPVNDSLDSLANYLSKYATDFLNSCGIRCRMDVPSDLTDHPLPADTRHNLFLVAKEALNNVAKHSKAREVWFRIHATPDGFTLAIEDDGIGMPTPSSHSTSTSTSTSTFGNGLDNMRRRMEQVGGSITISSRPEGGTRVNCTVPIPISQRPPDRHER